MAPDNSIGFNALFPGDKAGIDHLYRTHFEAVKRYITTHGGTDADAEDIYQEAFLALWRNVKTGKLSSPDEVNIGGYLFNIARFKWVDQVRKKQTHLKMLKEKLGETDREGVAEDESGERIAAVKKHLNELGESCKKVLLLFYYEKKTMKEIAAEMNWEEATARNNKYRCLQKLRNLMK